jgi:hypothetical protein
MTSRGGVRGAKTPEVASFAASDASTFLPGALVPSSSNAELKDHRKKFYGKKICG